MSTDDNNISALYHSNDKQEPPASLDSLIINAARDAVSEPIIDADASNKSAAPFSGRWSAVVSIAAVLVISVTLVPLVTQETPPAESRFSDKVIERALEQERKRDSFESETRSDSAESFKPMTMMNINSVESKAYKKESVPSAAEGQMMLAPPVRTESIRDVKQIKAQRSHALSESAFIDKEKDGVASGRSAPMAMHQMAADISLTPEQSLKKIRKLIDLSELKKARIELDKFKEQYPDEEVDQLILNKLLDE